MVQRRVMQSLPVKQYSEVKTFWTKLKVFMYLKKECDKQKAIDNLRKTRERITVEALQFPRVQG